MAIQIWLTEDSPAVRAQLQVLGFGIRRGGVANRVAGTVAVEKLEELAQLSAVKFVSLQRR